MNVKRKPWGKQNNVMLQVTMLKMQVDYYKNTRRTTIYFS